MGDPFRGDENAALIRAARLEEENERLRKELEEARRPKPPEEPDIGLPDWEDLIRNMPGLDPEQARQMRREMARAREEMRKVRAYLTQPFPRGVPDRLVIVARSKKVATAWSRTNDTFKKRHQEGTLIITVSGTVADGKDQVTEISIQDGDKTTKHASLDKVPEQYRARVKKVIDLKADVCP